MLKMSKPQNATNKARRSAYNHTPSGSHLPNFVFANGSFCPFWPIFTYPLIFTNKKRQEPAEYFAGSLNFFIKNA